jgi:hypothetical protein
MSDQEVRPANRPARIRALLAVGVAMMLAGAIVGVASGQSAPGTPGNPIAFGALATTGSVWVPLTPNRVLANTINLGLTGKLHSKVARPSRSRVSTRRTTPSTCRPLRSDHRQPHRRQPDDGRLLLPDA